MNHQNSTYLTRSELDGRMNKRPASTIVNIYLMIMFSFFTLFLTNQYASARMDKYYLYLALSAVTAAIVLFFWIPEYDNKQSKKSIVLSTKIPPLSVTDIAFLSFFGCAVISTLFSSYPLESLLGSAGRNNGLILLFAYTVVYLIVSRNYHHKHYVIAVYLVFSSIVALLAIINFFYIDPLNIYSGYTEEVIKDFGSTIGNKNTISAFMTIFLPVSVMTFVLTDKRYLKIISAVSILFAYQGLICANSSSGILGLMVILPMMLIFCSRSYQTLKNYMLALTILFASGKVLRLFSYLMDGHSKGFEFIQQFLTFSPLTYIPIAVFGLVYLLMRIFESKANPSRYPKKIFTAVFTTITVAAFVSFLYAILHFTLFDTETDLGQFERLLRFNDHWGTHRGFMWINGLNEYEKFDLYHLLFGSGPDTFAKVFEPYFGELSQRFGDGSTDCVHNEFINYLVTQGALGLLSYLTILISVCVRTIRRTKTQPISLIFISAVICCAAQSTVNLYQPITTPVFFLFLSMAEGLNRQADIIVED